MCISLCSTEICAKRPLLVFKFGTIPSTSFSLSLALFIYLSLSLTHTLYSQTHTHSFSPPHISCSSLLLQVCICGLFFHFTSTPASPTHTQPSALDRIVHIRGEHKFVTTVYIWDPWGKGFKSLCLFFSLFLCFNKWCNEYTIMYIEWDINSMSLAHDLNICITYTQFPPCISIFGRNMKHEKIKENIITINNLSKLWYPMKELFGLYFYSNVRIHHIIDYNAISSIQN